MWYLIIGVIICVVFLILGISLITSNDYIKDKVSAYGLISLGASSMILFWPIGLIGLIRLFVEIFKFLIKLKNIKY